MQKKSNEVKVLSCILAVTLLMCGCGIGNGGIGSQKGSEINQEEINYINQFVTLPACEAFDAYSDGGDLYYAATKLSKDPQQYETAFYRLKQGESESEMLFSLGENQMLQNMTMDAEGNIYCTSYELVPGDGGSSQAVFNLILNKLDQQGTPLLTLELSKYTQEQEQVMIQNLAVDGEKHIVLYASNQNILVLDPDGRLLFETRADGPVYDMCNSGGKVFVTYGGVSGVEIREIDFSGKKLSAKLEHNISGTRLYMAAGRNGSLLIAAESSVYQYDPEMKETVKKFDWQTYDYAGITAGMLLPYGENGVLAISRNYGSAPMKIEATAFREAAEGEVVVQEKTVITVGVPFYLPAAIKSEIVYFNKLNPDYKIEVKNYDEDYTRLITEITAGSGPDLLVMPSDKMLQFADKGILEDLNPYFNGDETLDRSDFFENILEAFETNGHLYVMPLKFEIYTIVGKESVLGDRTGWDLDELIAFVESTPKGTDIFDNTSKSGMLRMLKYAYTDQLVDKDNASAPLNRELLLKMLEFANRYENDDQYIYDTNLLGKVREQQVTLLDTRVYSGFGYFGYSSLLGEPVSYIGYPTEDRNGSLAYTTSSFAINSSSQHKDVAWEFISTLLSEEVQMRMEDDYSMKGFHIGKSALEYHFEWCLMDWGDNPNVYYIYVTSGEGFSYREFPGKITEEYIDLVRNLILSTDKAFTRSPDIDQIIEEEAASYFNGTKPVEEVVDVIENKVRTYVNEKK